MLNKIILFGDSVLFGTGASHRNSGCGRLLRTLVKVPVIIKGKNNDTTQEGLKRLATDVLRDSDSAVVFILFGNNDCKLKAVDEPIVSLSEYKDNLIKIIKQIKLNNKIPIISNLQPIDSDLFFNTLPQMRQFIVNVGLPKEWHKKYSLVCEEVAKAESIKLVDIRSILEKCGSPALAGDGIHPNDLGHKLISQKFFEVLKNIS